MASQELDSLTAEVADDVTVMASAATLIGGLAAIIAANAGTNPVLIKLAADLKASKDSLSAAVVANTPAA